MATPQEPAQGPADNPAPIVNLGNQVCQALGTGAISTKELATAVQADRAKVYRICRKLEKQGFLLRSPAVRPRLFCVDCRRVVASDNYVTCKGHDIRRFLDDVCEWKLIPQAPQAQQPKLN